MQPHGTLVHEIRTTPVGSDGGDRASSGSTSFGYGRLRARYPGATGAGTSAASFGEGHPRFDLAMWGFGAADQCVDK